jgi:hypothetical protein
VTTASTLFREITERGYRGCRGTVAAYLAPFRGLGAAACRCWPGSSPAKGEGQLYDDTHPLNLLWNAFTAHAQHRVSVTTRSGLLTRHDAGVFHDGNDPRALPLLGGRLGRLLISDRSALT